MSINLHFNWMTRKHFPFRECNSPGLRFNLLPNLIIAGDPTAFFSGIYDFLTPVKL